MNEASNRRAAKWFKSCWGYSMHVWGHKLLPDEIATFHTFRCIWDNGADGIVRTSFQLIDGSPSIMQPNDLLDEIIANMGPPEPRHVQAQDTYARATLCPEIYALSEEDLWRYTCVAAQLAQLPIAMLAIGSVAGGNELTAYTCSMPIMPIARVVGTLKKYLGCGDNTNSA